MFWRFLSSPEIHNKNEKIRSFLISCLMSRGHNVQHPERGSLGLANLAHNGKVEMFFSPMQSI